MHRKAHLLFHAKKMEENVNTDNNKHEADQRWFRVFTTIGIVIIIILLLLRSCGDAGMGGQDFIARIFDTAAEQSAVDEGVEKLSGDELQNLVDSQVSEGMIRISMNMDPVFASGTAAGNLNITNSETNRYPQIVEIYYGEQCVYRSGLIPVGKYVNNDTLDADLDAGDYPCIAYFHNVDPDTGADLGQAGAEITLHIEH